MLPSIISVTKPRHDWQLYASCIILEVKVSYDITPSQASVFIAYMDLQELGLNKNKKNKNLEVPRKNVKLVSLLPGKGMLRYHRALVMIAAGNLEAVVRTLSGDSTLRMNELQSSEVQHILKLPGDNSIMKLLGWCDTVPNYLICEYLSGGTLSDHLTEEFSPQKVHQYGNTKQKRFQVAEKGNAEHLPKYALQVARGLKFLTKHRITSANQKDMFRIVNKLTSPEVDNTLPKYDVAENLANRFVDFFQQKVNSLQHAYPDYGTGNTPMEQCKSKSVFTAFKEVSEQDVLEVINSSPVTSCFLDPLPTFVFKECISDLLPVITKIVNLSLTSGQLPCSLKQAVIIPHIKKPKLDANNLANYRPISNLPYLSKLIERIVCKQFQDYLSNNDLYARMQSAYRANYSTETAQLYVQNSLLCALDERKDALLVLLDFSSAFDTINHQTLLTRLHERYGVDGIPLYWMKSYLANRTQCVIVDQNLSKDVTLATGVPQGSVLGPLLYTLYVAPLHDLIISANMQTVIYADDIQLFTSFHPDHCSDAIQKIQNCIADVKSWAISNNLFINDSKTEILHATSQFKSTTIKSISVKIDQTTITPSTHVKSLGVVLDPHLSMKQQVNAVCKSSYNAVRKISRIRKFLTKDITTKLFVNPGLRSKKVLLDAAGRCKLYDFVSMENAKEWTKLFWNENVPFQWMSPEFLFLETISPAGDVWSFGVLLWEIFSYGSEPYKGQNRSDVEKSLREKRQLPMPDNCPGAIWQVMITCREPAVEERLKIDDVTYKLAAMCHEDKVSVLGKNKF
ncbi:putative RNA-directed DNA polymerase from mobile element jockey-like [Apostichopus japonicus]|uniref:Putative RNA-directed DNA polymerase from mobile element jockey-like n=1 Tax=Stichopus japonicus TaxID=307972 RepID=A0A2G8KXI7_STIJA|nr:putative RNA-directed DNA polymerase from mobile element jockey-like [Apostichopus japonicus]